MWFIRTSKVRTDPLGKLFGGQQTIPFDHIALCVNPFGFDRVEPGAFRGQKEGQNTHLCWLLGTSVLKIGILYPMKQAFLPKHVKCEYNQQGPCCSHSLETRLFSRRRGSVRVLSAHLHEATHRFPLSHASRTCAPLDQTPNDLSSTRHACR